MAKTITRKNVVTSGIVSVIHRETHDITSECFQLNGYLSKSEVMSALLDASLDTPYMPLNIESVEYSVQTRGMDYDRWYTTSEVYAAQDVTEAEAAAFGKRTKCDNTEPDEADDIVG